MDDQLKKLIELAKSIARAEGADTKLDFAHIFVAIYRLRDEEKFQSLLKTIFPHGVTFWPDEVLNHLLASAEIPPQGEAFSLELTPGFRNFYRRCKQQSDHISLQTFLQQFFSSETSEDFAPLAAFIQANNYPKTSGEGKQRVGMLGRMRAKWKAAFALEAELLKFVVGQNEAVAVMRQGYLRTLLQQSGTGLRGIFTFMGPPGVGKTFLAETFAQALAAVEEKGKNQPYELVKFSMEAAHHQGFLFELFGTEAHYSNSRCGRLTEAIQKNPRRVLLFDEIEKAAPEVIQSLLTLIDRGEFKDKKTGETVKLHQCFLIFTTNLGQELFATRNQSGILRGTDFSADELFDILATAKRREYAKMDDAPAVFSPEFVSRLRKGQAVLFNQFKGSDYEKLLSNSFEQINQRNRMGDLPPVSLETKASKLITMGFLPEITPRKVSSQAEALHLKWMEQILLETPKELSQKDPESFSMCIRRKLDSQSENLLQNVLNHQPLSLLVLDDDNRMGNFLRSHIVDKMGTTKLDINSRNTLNDVEDWLRTHKPDLIFLDLELSADKLPPGGYLAAHKLLRQASPDSGIVLFSEHPDLSREDRLAIMEQGGALEFLNFRDSAGDALLDEDQIARLSALVEARLFEKLIADFVRTRRKFTWDSQLEYSDADNTLYINLHKITQKQDVPPSTSSSGFQPSPIPQVTFDDVFGLERAKERLSEAVALMKDPGKLAAFGVAPPSGFLLAGPSGTGKTHLARAVANAANCVFYSLSAGELESKWVGEGEERIRELFASARKYAPAVIFIDEIDAIATRREAMPSHSNHAVKLLNQLLVCMDGFSTAKGQVLVLAATNRPEALDPAVLRPGRFDETIRIEAPDAKAREQMFLQRLAKIPMDNREAIQSSAANLVCRTAGMSPAQIDRVIREAAYAAARENRKTISLSDIETAIAFVRYGAAKRDIKITPKDRERTAWHEAGHAIARLTLFPESKLDYLSIVPNEDGSLGFAAWQEDESKHTYSAEDYKKLIMVSLAGREGEKLCPGAGADAINTGVSSDYERATHRAWQYVSRFGFDEEFGVFCLGGTPASIHPILSESIKPRVDALLATCLEETRLLMQEKKPQIEALVAALLEKDALDGMQVENLISG